MQKRGCSSIKTDYPLFFSFNPSPLPMKLPLILSLLVCLSACSTRKDKLRLQKAEQFYAEQQMDSTLFYLNRIVPEVSMFIDGSEDKVAKDFIIFSGRCSAHTLNHTLSTGCLCKKIGVSPKFSKTPPYRLIVWIEAGKRLHVFLKDADLSLKRPYVSAHTY